MIKTLYNQIGQYWRASLLTPVWTAAEVVMDVLIPYVTASLIDKGIMTGDITQVYYYGLLMIGMAFLSLGFGILAGRSVAYAATGFAANLRSAMYRNIQRFAFSNIDKFSTSGLVTRMTTDVANLQNAYQQILRITVRAPFRLLLSIVMCLVIDARLSIIFIVAMVVLGFSLYHIISRVARLFQQVFEKYDHLNQSVQENVQAIRVVKAFVREDYENQKFSKAAEALYHLYVRAESLMALNHPVMNMVVYGCIIALSWWGAHFIVSGTLTTGELTSLFTYVMSILQSLMMLSMIFVMLTQSAASGRRVAEVIDEEPDIVNPENPVYEVADGSLEFHEVRFDYGVYGVNGIDGSLSTAAGFSCVTDYQVFCVIGDLSFFYDQNALWNQNLKGNLRILLLNNGKGGIFNMLKGLEQSPARDKYVSAAHHTTAKGICQQNDVVYLKAENTDEMRKGIDTLLNTESQRPVLLEVFTDAGEDERVLKDYYANLLCC